MVNKKVSAAALSISISSDNVRMAVGHSNGWIAFWNIDFLIEPKLLKVVDFSKTSVISIDFIGNENELIVASDMGGLVSLF